MIEIKQRIAALLTQKETEILIAVVKGNTTSEIAAQRGLSTRTVESFRAKMMVKLKARNVAELVRIALLGE